MTLFTSLLFFLCATGLYTEPTNPHPAPPRFMYPGDAPYGVKTTILDSVMTCPQDISSSSRNAVLLVHGTGSNGNESWSSSFSKSLPTAGFATCYIDLPDRALSDAQISAAYIAYNMHKLSNMAGGHPIAVISHSQGGPDTQWALRFWPSTQKIVRAFVGLSPDLAGVDRESPLSLACYTTDDVTPLCEPSLWQQAIGSNFTDVLKNGAKAEIPTTLLWSEDDTTVLPPKENAQLHGATSYSVQQLCPGTPTDHVGMLFAPAPFFLAVDALQHNGRAELRRVKSKASAICAGLTAPGLDDADVAYIRGSAGALTSILAGGKKVKHEPLTKPYARRYLKQPYF